MFKKLSTLLIILFSITFTTLAQSSKPQLAENVLKSALSQANYYNKNVLVVFHSSWCGWCKRLAKVINNSEITSILNSKFAIAYIDVREKGELVKLIENPGGQEMMAKFGGASSGLPFYVFLDSKGNKILSDTGYPSSDGAITDFVSQIKRSAKNIDNGSLSKISEFLKKVSPKD